MARIQSMWGESGVRPAPLTENAEAFGRWTLSETVVVNCSQGEAWSLVADVTRMGEFSPECVEVRWTLGSTAAVGNRFDGTNQASVEVDGEVLEVQWIRPCTITRCEPNSVFAYTVGDRYDGTAASEWEFALTTTAEGRCTITQTFRHEPDGLSGVRLQADADPSRTDEIIRWRTRDLAEGMLQTLSRMKELLEREGAR